MFHIAVVEDDLQSREQLLEYLRRYEAEYGEQFQVETYTDGLELVEQYRTGTDIIFLDIQMQNMDGMEAARRIRLQDQTVIIIFITNLAQYAVQGYQVEALSYVLKPVSYFAFSQELRRAVQKVQRQGNNMIAILHKNGMLRLPCSDLTYVESQGNNVIYHTREHSYVCRESLKNVEEKLAGRDFYRCNSCYLVNLACVERVESSCATVGGETLQISRSRKKGFMEALAAYVGGQ